MKNKTDAFEQVLRDADDEYFKKLAENPPVTWIPSERFEKNMQEIIEKQRRGVIVPRTVLVRKVACFIIAFVIVAGSLFSVSAIRQPVVNFFVSIFETFSSVSTNDEVNTTAPSTLVTIYHPSTVPEGYTISSVNADQILSSITYINSTNQIISFKQSVLSHTHFMIDTEETTLIDIIIDEYNGQYFINDDNISMYWITEEYSFFLSLPSTFTLDEAVAIAESLEPQTE